MSFDPRFPMPLLKGQALQTYLKLEELRTAAEGYEESEKVVLRKNALRWILEVSKCENFDASIPYIAMNYFDRFISRHQVPHVIGRFRIDFYVFCISCVVLAWRLRYQCFKSETTFLARNDLKYLRTPILRVEVELINGLNWKMTPITALCFVDPIIERIPDANGINRRFINEIIIQTQGDIAYTRFRQSLIAASAILSACRAQFFVRYNTCRGSLLELDFVNEADLDTCTNKISAMCVDKRITVHGHLKVAAGETSQVGAVTSEAGQSSQVGAGTAKAAQSSQVGAGTTEAGQSSQEKETSSEGGQISEVGTSSIVMVPPRPGKEPIEETSAPELTRQKAITREREQEITGMQQVQDPGSRNIDDLNFELKWILWSADGPEDLVIESARFRPLPEGEAQDDAESTATTQKCAYCNVM